MGPPSKGGNGREKAESPQTDFLATPLHVIGVKLVILLSFNCPVTLMFQLTGELRLYIHIVCALTNS